MRISCTEEPEPLQPLLHQLPCWLGGTHHALKARCTRIVMIRALAVSKAYARSLRSRTASRMTSMARRMTCMCDQQRSDTSCHQTIS